MIFGVLGSIPLVKLTEFTLIFWRVRVILSVRVRGKLVIFKRSSCYKIITWHSLKLETVFHHVQYLLYML